MNVAAEISMIALVILVLLVLLIVSISLIAITKTLSKFTDKITKLRELELYDGIYNSRENIDRLLDDFIMDRFVEYKVFNPETFQNEYLSDKELEKISNELLNDVTESISVSLLNELALIYNKNKLYSIIKNKVWMVVINDGVEHNSLENPFESMTTENITYDT